MHPAVGKQPHQVKCSTRLLYFFHALNQHLVLEERPLSDAFGNPGQVLVDDAAGSNVEVPNL